MSYRDPPSLRLLIGFETAARLMSFKKAAEELGVTPSAISQRIQKLEERLGFDLFERLVQGIALTPDGARYLVRVRRLLTEATTIEKEFVTEKQGILTIAMNTSVAHGLVIPIFSQLEAQLGGGRLEIITRPTMKTFRPDDADAGIRIGYGSWPGFEHRVIGKLTTAALCAPRHARSMRNWDDFMKQPICCAKARRSEMLDAWRHPVTGERHEHVIEFQTMLEAVHAAEAGVGVAPAFFPVMTKLVRGRGLKIAFNAERPLPESLIFIYRQDHPERGKLEAIFEILKQSFAQLPRPATLERGAA